MESLYFIAIIPPDHIEREIEEIKRYLCLHYKTKASLRSPGHITLHMPFKWKDCKEPILFGHLKEYVKDQKSFDVRLSGFGAFPPRVIYIDVEKNDALQEFQKQLLKFSKLNLKLFNGNYKEHAFLPHVTVAFRDLKKNLFFPAYEEFRDKSFSASFQVDYITLLKHTGKEWVKFMDFLFN